MSRTRLSVILAGLMVLAFTCAIIIGCSEATSAISVMGNLNKDKSLLKVSLDGMEAKQNTLKKAATGYSQWDIKEQVNADNIKLAYKLVKPEKFGRITFTVVNIFQEFKGDYSTQSEFVVTPKEQKSECLMKEGTTYELGNPPAFMKVIDVNSKEVKGVKLEPGKKYMLQLTIRGDHSETACIYFKTK